MKKELLSIWRAMHNRCYNLNQKSYQHYGARGIFVEESWHGKQGFANFVRDMGERPEGGTIDRIDNNKSYSPHNCHWANAFEQAKNKRNNRWITSNGETKTSCGVGKNSWMQPCCNIGADCIRHEGGRSCY